MKLFLPEFHLHHSTTHYFPSICLSWSYR